MWEARSRELGIRVAGTMVEMGDLELAGKLLESLRVNSSSGTREKEEIARLKPIEALIWLRVSDLGSARRCLSSMPISESDTEPG
jgi:hypothetical protein